MLELIIGATAGFAVGVITGATISVTVHGAMWPNAWRALLAGSTLIGGVIGCLALLA